MKFLNLIVLLVISSATLTYAQESKSFDPYNKVRRMENFFRDQGYTFNTLSGGFAQGRYYEFNWSPRKIVLTSPNQSSADDSRNEVLAKQNKNQVCVLLSDDKNQADHLQFACFLNMVKQ
ncbi:MAG: hypothetical protein H7061_07525 [Bdellovibrionaceae bacterium]|nr:hypothetical protein [Bdellovibrio sp.]